MVAVVHESTGHRVIRGFLGCPACESRFSVDDAVVYLKELGSPPSPGESTESPGSLADEGALLVGAVLELAQGNGYALLGPELVGIADDVAALAGGWEIVSLTRARPATARSVNLSRIVVPEAAPPPVLRGRFGAVALAGDQSAGRIREFASALRPHGRLAIVTPGQGAVAELRDAGLEVIASDDRVAVASRRV
jgi:SAM-dependent methyltransferase